MTHEPEGGSGNGHHRRMNRVKGNKKVASPFSGFPGDEQARIHGACLSLPVTCQATAPAGDNPHRGRVRHAYILSARVSGLF